MNQPLLEIKDVTKFYGKKLKQNNHQMIALQHFNMVMPSNPAKIVTIAGESGSGKTTLADLILGFIKPSSGQILYKGKNVSQMNKEEMHSYRREVQAVFQDPYSVYNPFYQVKHIFDVVLNNYHLSEKKNNRSDYIEDALSLVGLKGEDVLYKYPHQLSGGQLQRIMIARAYMLKPSLIVADEPVSMIDVSFRAMILEIMIKFRDEFGISFLYITHDFSTAYQIGDEIFLLYRGITVEKGNTVKVISNPQHPYTKNLVSSIPSIDKKWEGHISIADNNEMGRGNLLSAPAFTEVEPEHWVILPL